MKVLYVSVDSAWVLRHRGDDELPMRALFRALEKILPSGFIRKKNIQLTELCLHVEGDWNEAQFHARVEQAGKETFEDWTGCGLEVSLQDEENPSVGEEDGSFEEEKPRSTTNRPAQTAPRMEGNADTPRSGGWSLDEEKVEQRIRSIENLMGAEEFKALAKELVTIAPQIVANKTQEIFTYQSYLFSVNTGFGLTTYLQTFAELLNEIHIQPVQTDKVQEIVLGAPKGETDEPFEDAKRELRLKSGRGVSVVCLDISEWMGLLDSRPFRRFLEFVESRLDERVVVFRIPFVDREVLERIRSSLNDIMYVRPVAFPPLGVEDLLEWGCRELEKYGFQVAKDAKPYLRERLLLERSDGKFYGLNTVRKVMRELLYKKQLLNAREKQESKNITVAEAKLICGETDKQLTGEQMLAEMVGGAKMKEQISSIVSQIEMSREEGGSNAPCIHMRFSGNPGTGKTTVARIIGKILKEKGLLRIGNFYEYAGREFCGRYIGETAPKTASMCRDAYGSVLFIDEAYSLYRGDGNDRDYGREAIDTLIAEMENHRHDLVVIMAGYSDEMEILMKGNSGLASRMPYLIEFPNFTREELYQIFENMSTKKWQCDEGYLREAKLYFDGLPDSVLQSKEFSNARFVRNLYERAWAKAMLRCQLNRDSEKKLTRDDFVRATADTEFAINEKKKTRLGFYEE